MSKKNKVILNADSILAASDLKIQDINVPEWGGVVRIREFNLAMREQFSAYCQEHQGRGVLAYVVALSLIDESGNPLFSIEDISKIEQKNPSIIDKICAAAMTLNGLAFQAEEDAEKN